jgi:uncharacterized protein YjbI with pentapeptide repeats
MANEEQLSVLKQGVDVWNKWRTEHYGLDIDLSEANLGEVNLKRANFSEADLSRADLHITDLSGAKLIRAVLNGANLRGAALNGANLNGANLRRAQLVQSNLRAADLREAHLRGANLREAFLKQADLRGAILSEVDFRGANLGGANLSGANLRKCDLTGADLSRSLLIGAEVDKAKVSESWVYGISVWDLEGEFEEQRDLVITPHGAPVITVDNIKVAQFVYLILDNKEIREVFNTLTSKSVLILGRFTIPERKTILDCLKDKLREYNLLPIVFDFDRPTDKDFTETIKTLASLSYFVIADVTNPKSSPLELQATVPDYQIPFVPIIQEGESPFAMMVDLQKKYDWVLKIVTYDSMETLIKVLKPLIIDPAMKKRQELRIIKAQEPEIISGKEYVAKGKL